MAARSGDQFMRVGPHRLRFRDEGAGPAVVFIHGWTLDLEVWDPQAAALRARFRVVRHDRRGFGLSEGAPGHAADVADLGRLLDHLELADAALVGLSQGARVALAFALRHPKRVAALVLDGPPDETGAAGDEDFSMAACRSLARERGVDAFRAEWRAHPLMRLHGNDPAARAIVDRALGRYPARDLLDSTDAPPPPAGAAALARCAKPALVINGELDTPVRRRGGEAIARALPRGERVVLAGAGHLPNLDAASAYNAAVQAFLRRQSRAAA
jgi:pimeloyl-ACP methyl ester carboxylesterase